MATTYKKNAQNVYKPPLYAQFWTWWASALTLAVLSLVVGLVVSIKIRPMCFMVAGRYIDDLASVYADRVSDQNRDNQTIHYAEKSRKSSH